MPGWYLFNMNNLYNLPKKTLFTWQQECLERWFKNGSRGIVNVVTGGGKTLLALGAVYNIKESLKVKIVVPKVFLVSQWINDLKSELNIPREQIGIFDGTHKNRANKNFMIYVINSARYSISRHILNDMEEGFSVLLICDECHHYGSGENSKIFDFLPFIHQYDANYYSLGLSATPDSPNYREILVPALGKEIYNLGFSQAISENIISKYSLFNISLQFDIDEAEEYANISEKIFFSLHALKKKAPYLNALHGARFFSALQDLCSSSNAALARTTLMLMYKRKKIVYSARARLDCTRDIIDLLETESKIIVFCEQISMAETLYTRLAAKYTGQVGRYHSKMSDAAKINTLSRYRNSEIRILLCCHALDEGLNVPETDAGIILSSTGSIRQRVQRIGRILRRCTDERMKNVYYLHIANSSEEDGLVTPEIYGDLPVCQMTYNHESNDFFCAEYEQLVKKINNQLKTKGTPPEVIGEFNKNLKSGLIRGDWKLSRNECAEKIKSTKSTAEKNYWIAMLMLAKE